MPAGKRPQSNAMLYTLITFVALFILATTAAIIYYVKHEEQRSIAEKSKQELDKVFSRDEQQKTLGKIVGVIPRDKTGLGMMVDYLDQTLSLITGVPVEDTSAQVKFSTANDAVRQTIKLLGPEYVAEDVDPNSAGLVRIIKRLKEDLDNIANIVAALSERLEELQNEFDDAQMVSLENQQTLLADKERYHQQVQDIEERYNKLRAQVEQSADETVKSLMAQLDEEETAHKDTEDSLRRALAERDIARVKMQKTQRKLQGIQAGPAIDVAAYEPDGKVMLIDDLNKIVHLNIGSDDRVYRGLTFSIYDKSVPIPKDGKGKAEVEVFDVKKNISVARIISSKPRYPVILDDIVANLIWDSDKINTFVVIGEFDLDGDETIDYGATDKIKTLIQKWGSRVDDTVSIDTDFLVLGKAPRLRQIPTPEEMELYPTALEKYETSLKELNAYREAKDLAQSLTIPIFNYERFLYFIGYRTQSSRVGAF